MRKFKGLISTIISGSGCEFEFEVEDDATQEEIEESAEYEAFDKIDWHYEEIN